jgi:hypothetical protein
MIVTALPSGGFFIGYYPNVVVPWVSLDMCNSGLKLYTVRVSGIVQFVGYVRLKGGGDRHLVTYI